MILWEIPEEYLELNIWTFGWGNRRQPGFPKNRKTGSWRIHVISLLMGDRKGREITFLFTERLLYSEQITGILVGIPYLSISIAFDKTPNFLMSKIETWVLQGRALPHPYSSFPLLLLLSVIPEVWHFCGQLISKSTPMGYIVCSIGYTSGQPHPWSEEFFSP